jgi:Zn-dependent oligopeptidase
VRDLSDKMVQELQKLQQSSADLSSSLATSLHSASAAQQDAFNEISATLLTTISDLSNILGQPIPLNEKVSRVGAEINNKVRPVLDRITKKVSEAVGAVRSRAENAKSNGINGYADGKPHNGSTQR